MIKIRKDGAVEVFNGAVWLSVGLVRKKPTGHSGSYPKHCFVFSAFDGRQSVSWKRTSLEPAFRDAAKRREAFLEQVGENPLPDA